MARKILFFLESFNAGGKERRAVELLHYLKRNTDFEIQIAITEEEIHYKDLLDLDILIIILKRKLLRKDPAIFFKFYYLVKQFKPDIIHTWGAMTTLYAIPSAKIFNIHLINGQIGNSFSKKNRSNFLNFIWSINRKFSSKIISNSYAGLKAYDVRLRNGVVIYNGIRLERFNGLNERNLVKSKFKINTPFTIIMVASFGKYKDYDLFFKVAKKLCNIRKDVTFVAIGDGESRNKFVDLVKNESLERVLFTGRIANVEELINASDIGVLFSNLQTGEGISNTIMEYMALSKPVIATDAGGTNELILNDRAGFLVNNNIDTISEIIMNLLDYPNLRRQMGKEGRLIIENHFTLDKMGEQFVLQYNKYFNK